MKYLKIMTLVYCTISQLWAGARTVDDLTSSVAGVALKGDSDNARQHLDQLVRFSLQIYREFPHLYVGREQEFAEYLEPYFKSKESAFVLMTDTARTSAASCTPLIGAAFCIPLSQEIEALRKPLEDGGVDASRYLYIGQALIAPTYRGEKILSKMMALLINHVESNKHAPYTHVCFASVWFLEVLDYGVYRVDVGAAAKRLV